MDQLKIFFTGKFNVNLDDWREDVEDHGGTVTKDCTMADIGVVSEQANEDEILYLKQKGKPCMDLEQLQKVLDGVVAIAEAVETPSKVSFAKERGLSPKSPKEFQDQFLKVLQVVRARCQSQQQEYQRTHEGSRQEHPGITPDILRRRLQ